MQESGIKMWLRLSLKTKKQLFFPVNPALQLSPLLGRGARGEVMNQAPQIIFLHFTIFSFSSD